MKTAIAVAATMLVAHAVVCSAQELTGQLEGQVLDPEAKPVDFVNVVATSPGLQGVRGAVSAKDGFFRLLALPVGVYSVKLTHISYQEVTIEDVTVSLGRTTTVGAIRLSERPVEMEEVIVSGRRLLIDPVSTSIGANLNQEEFRDLPVDRNYKNVPLLLPQANESFLGDETNYAGSTGLENKYFIEGVDVTDPLRGVTGTSLPYNFVKEIEVRTGGYEAEYRSSLGGIINVITPMGGNEIHGQVFGFLVNNRLSGDAQVPALEPSTGDFAEYDVGFSVGGPIRRDRLWFFASYAPTFADEHIEIPGQGFYKDNNTQHTFAGKLAWQPTNMTNLALAIFGDPGRHEAVGRTFGGYLVTPVEVTNPDAYLGIFDSGGVSVALNAKHFVNDRFLLEPTLSRIVFQEGNRPATDRGASEVLFVDAETATWSGGYPEESDYSSVVWHTGIKTTYMLDAHTLKAGFEYKDNGVDMERNWAAVFRVPQDSAVVWWDYNEVARGSVHNRIPSLFVQDSWRLGSRLRLNLGLRWDGQYLIGSDGKVAQRITNQYQPRVGFVYLPGEVGSQRVFGSVGRFYQELSTDLSIAFHMEDFLWRIYFYDHDPRIDPSNPLDRLEIPGGIDPEVEGLQGQYFDELSVGYERQLGREIKVGATGIYRTLGQGIEDAWAEDKQAFVIGNPGRGSLSNYPEMEREYAALVLTAEGSHGARFNFLGSYVLSRTHGNYTGLFNSDFNWASPNRNGAFDQPELLVNGTGLLPNDRTHSFKFFSSYRFDYGLTVGGGFLWQSGTPLSEFGGSSLGSPYQEFMRQRGTAGRTPSIWDLSLRFAYDLNALVSTSWNARLILDVLHVGSERTPVNFDQIHYFGVDDLGNQTNPNPFYGSATAFLPPTTARLGMEVDF